MVTWVVDADDEQIGIVMADDQEQAVNKAIDALPADYRDLSDATMIAWVIE